MCSGRYTFDSHLDSPATKHLSPGISSPEPHRVLKQLPYSRATQSVQCQHAAAGRWAFTRVPRRAPPVLGTVGGHCGSLSGHAEDLALLISEKRAVDDKQGCFPGRNRWQRPPQEIADKLGRAD